MTAELQRVPCQSETALEIALPLLRLLSACLLMVLAPLYLGFNRLSPAWLLVPSFLLTYVSCTMQGYRTARLVALCTASVSVTVVALYAGAYLAAGVFRP